MWFGDLIDTRELRAADSRQNIYIRLPISQLASKRNHEGIELPLFKMVTNVEATNNFSRENMIGVGGFETVDKVMYCMSAYFDITSHILTSLSRENCHGVLSVRKERSSETSLVFDPGDFGFSLLNVEDNSAKEAIFNGLSSAISFWQVFQEFFFNFEGGESNHRDYLFAGKTVVPQIYFSLAVIYVVLVAVWVKVLYKGIAIFRIHFFVMVVVLLRALNLLCEDEEHYSVLVKHDHIHRLYWFEGLDMSSNFLFGSILSQMSRLVKLGH